MILRSHATLPMLGTFVSTRRTGADREYLSCTDCLYCVLSTGYARYFGLPTHSLTSQLQSLCVAFFFGPPRFHFVEHNGWKPELLRQGP